MEQLSRQAYIVSDYSEWLGVTKTVMIWFGEFHSISF